MFMIGWFIRFSINNICTVNYLDSFSLIANIYYFFIACLATFSEVYGLLNNLPSIFELYNSIYHGVRLFSFDQYIKTKIPTVNTDHIYMVETPDETRGGSQSKGKNVDTSQGDKSPVSRPNSPGSDTSETEYWKNQLFIYKHALTSIGKPNYSLTVDEIYAKEEVCRMDEYSEEKIKHAMTLIERNINFPYNDPEAVRLEKMRLDMDRDAEMRTKSYIAWAEKQALLSSARRKLELLAEYNRKNHHSFGIHGISKLPQDEVQNLTVAELKCVVDVINSDSNVSPDIRSRVINGTIRGGINVNNPIIKYLDNIIVKK